MNQTRSGFVAIVGRPNVGKSSLLNTLIGEKVAIVTDKPQTTRTRITGVLTKDEMQMVFIDTPGLHKPRTALSEHMVKAANESIRGVDVAVVMVEPTGEPTKVEMALIENIRAERIPALLVINKIDLVPQKERLMERIQAFSDLHDFVAILPVSVLYQDGVELVMSEIMKLMPEGPHYFPDDTLTDQPERAIVAEKLRESLLTNLDQEVPHGIAVVIETMKERETGDLMDIEAYIYCERDGHKGIVIGKHGAMLKKIATAARAEIEEFLGIRVNLQCWVKVKEGWRNREGLIRNFGLE